MTTTFNHLRKMIGIIDLIIEMIIGQKTTLISFAFRIFLSFQTAGSSTWTRNLWRFSMFFLQFVGFVQHVAVAGCFLNGLFSTTSGKNLEFQLVEITKKHTQNQKTPVISMVIFLRFTPPKFNMEPENKSLQKESPFGNHYFQVPC